MRELRRERKGVERQLADITAALDAGREVFRHGLSLLDRPDELYGQGSDLVRGILIKALLFTRLYVVVDEERHTTVARVELAEPFDALSAAQTAWRSQSTQTPTLLTPKPTHTTRAAPSLGRTPLLSVCPSWT